MNTETLTIDRINQFYNLVERPKGNDWTLDESYNYCKRLTFSHYENFPVGSLLFPKPLRPHVHAIYSFARVADDFSDEKEYIGTRLTCLADWEQKLHSAYEGKADNPIFIALADTAEKYELPKELFLGLLTAFKRDVEINRYETYDSLINDYCINSANPVGRLILRLFRYADDQLLSWSDDICTALQLTNFWQDVEIDLQKDRIYIPKECMAEHRYTEEELFNKVYDDRYKKMMVDLGLRTWELFHRGFPLVERVHWPLSAELSFTWLGGATILKRNHKNGYNVFAKRPKLSKFDCTWLAMRSIGIISPIRNRMQKAFQPII